jgi:hypothetical protein
MKTEAHEELAKWWKQWVAKVDHGCVVVSLRSENTIDEVERSALMKFATIEPHRFASWQSLKECCHRWLM